MDEEKTNQSILEFKLETPLDVEVKRSKWSGDVKNDNASMLYNSHSGRLCCLGFLCEVLKVPTELIKGRGYIHSFVGLPEVPTATFEILKKLFVDADWTQSELSKDLTQANDAALVLAQSRFKTQAEKEAYIIERGAKAGINFTFVD